MKEKRHGKKDNCRDSIRVENKDERTEAVGHGHFAHYHVSNLSKNHYHHTQKRH